MVNGDVLSGTLRSLNEEETSGRGAIICAGHHELAGPPDASLAGERVVHDVIDRVCAFREVALPIEQNAALLHLVDARNRTRQLVSAAHLVHSLTSRVANDTED